MKKIFFALLVTGAACGGGSSQPTAPVAPEPAPMTEAPATPAEPAPAEPEAPAEPPPPPAPDPAKIKADLLAMETAAFDKAKPVFDKWCAKCHTKGGKAANAKKREHFDMTSYPFTGEHAMEIGEEIREVLGLTGKKPTMPADKKGAVKGEELELIKAWADAFDASHKGGAHEGHGGHQH